MYVLKHPWPNLWLLRDDIVSQTLADGNHWDPHVFDAIVPYLRADGVFIDAGANVGPITLRVAPRVQQVMAFEPNYAMFGCLVQNYRDLGLLNVCGYPWGLYSRRVRIAPTRQAGNSPSSWTWREDSGRSAGIAEPLGLPVTPVCVIKVDVQGADLHALLGCSAVIERDHPAIVFEFEPDLAELHGHSWEDYERQLTAWGYKLKDLADRKDWLAVYRG